MTDNKKIRIGIDVGSTTLKIVLLDSNNNILYKTYRRHKTDFNSLLVEEITKISAEFKGATFSIGVTGSAGMGIADRIKIDFFQEVVASIEAIRHFVPEATTLIDLGGEDAKMVFFTKNKQADIRMNGTCAGGTGAFIDQMADLMKLSPSELGKEALKYDKIYPVASRCGVFAKTDVQNLISRNIPVANIAMSIFHTVALQSVTSLARGHDIIPKIVCIGGPLTFIEALRNAFVDVLKINNSDLILPENSEFFPAIGAALLSKEDFVINSFDNLIKELSYKTAENDEESLTPLFANADEYEDWKKQRKIKKLQKHNFGDKKSINCFLGIDSGSTTSKIIIIDESGDIVFSYYSANEGNPLKKILEGMSKFFSEAEEKGVEFRFLASASTGYGEELIKSALNLDFGIVETMAHLSGAQSVDPEVSFVLDIGGQDIKSIFTNKGVISNIELNEACSSGCGSFLQNFASTMNLSLSEFTKLACEATAPSDLGSRCTVFMNSKVKQSLRTNAHLGDIAAGLAYSVVKNCLFKVLKISNLNILGDHIVVQGGTFRNDAVYRALELLSGKTVSSTDMPELMGALGAALYAQKKWQQEKFTTNFNGISKELPLLEEITKKELFCKGCNNRCSVLQFIFKNGNICYAGNKCEKIFFSKSDNKKKGYNAFDIKNSLLFDRATESKKDDKKRIRIGIPRVLNMFENFPFWHSLFTNCGYEVVISPESTFSLFQQGVGTVMSDNICFPAKIVHGHIVELSKAKVDRIFYPIVPKDEKEFESTNNTYNCPVVSGYPDVIRNSMDPEEKFGIPFDKPVINFSDKKALQVTTYKYFKTLGIDKKTFDNAFRLALAEREKFKNSLFSEQNKILEKAISKKELVFIVAGRPYHADPLINQKVGQILSDLGVIALTDDVFRQYDSEGFKKLNMVSQWSYPNRVVQASMEVAKLPANVQLVQLNSFGCGPDSFFMDETGDILKHTSKNHTIVRIDEIASPGSIRLRLRSLIESLKAAYPQEIKYHKTYSGSRIPFTKEDRKKTILAPWFADFVSPFIPPIAALAGYNFVNLPKTTKKTAELGLVYGHNEVCYPSTLVLGDIIYALKSGKYDLDNIVVAITQTGGQCRATNYLAQIKAGMQNAGFSNIPVVVVSAGKVFQNEQKAFDFPYVKLLPIILHALLFADGLQQMYNSLIVREQNAGDTQRLFDHYVNLGIKCVEQKDHKSLLPLFKKAVEDFNSIDVQERQYSKIGLIGEIYVKYNNYGQAHITEWLRTKNMEVVTPPIIDFFVQYFVNSPENDKNLVSRNSLLEKLFTPFIWKKLNERIIKYEKALEKFNYYIANESIFEKAEYASDILDLSNQFGEGWSIAGEVASYARRGINKVVCVQPFGCIANHVVAKGIEKRIKKFYPEMNLLYLDIDGGMAEVNLHNRLHFLIND